MNRRRWFIRCCGLTLLASVALYAGGCSSDDHSDAEEANPALTDVVYLGASNDEGLEALLEATPVDNADRAPVITAPAEGETLTAATTFTYEAPGVTARIWQGSRKQADPLAPVRALFGPERLAHAHGAPM